ncbi:GtrA family protein [Pseudomonas putida]|uniref:Bactoprenol-linked glucose translocase n=1 Tax=Pseudomonas putida TaxID=303 RepID=A0A4D6XE92_PSEPU|nr:GtrA family protein [Pseudomonas putida]QCI10805.1 GtrA family protein [Pseudomonas putida]
MRAISRQLCRYALVGAINTGCHWLVFLLLHLGIGASQALSNLTAFGVAASLSYFANAAFTFAVRPSGTRYLLFLTGMGSLSLLLGALADWAGLAPWLTLVSFSAASLVIGYAYSRAVVFKRSEP